MKIGIAVRWLTRHDAVSNDVFGMYHALKNQGYDAYIFYQERHWRTLTKTTYPVSKVKNILKDPEDILIYHFTSGWNEGLQFLKKLSCIKVIRYHGITPANYFEGISTSHAQRARLGYKNLTHLTECSISRFFTNSQHMAKDLALAGAKECDIGVIPPFHPIETLLMTEPKKKLMEKLHGKTNILTVGRISPHKGHMDLIKAFSYYFKEYNNQSRLILFGKQSSRLKQYTDYLYDLIDKLHLKDSILIFDGGSPAILRAIYASTQIFIAPSLHEGFCVPIIEAMAHKIPIIGRNATAISETLDGSGLLWSTGNPINLGALIHDVVSDPRHYKELSQKGWHSYQEKYKLGIIENTFIGNLKKLIDKNYRSNFNNS